MAGNIKTFGLLFILVGALVMAGPTFGFSTIGADRSVSVASADDGDGLIGIEEVYNSNVIFYSDSDGQSNDEPVLTLENNLGQPIGDSDLDIQIESVSGGAFDQVPVVIENKQDTFDGLETAETIDIIVGCSRNEDTGGAVDVDITFSINGEGITTSVTEKRVTVIDVAIDCEEDDQDRVEQEPGTPVEETDVQLDDAFASAPRGNTPGTVTFLFTNTGSETLTIEALEIRNTSQTVTIGLDKPGNQAQVRVESGGVTGEIASDGVVRFGDGGILLDNQVPVDSNQGAEITMENFIDVDTTGNQGLDMSGEDVTVVLYFDGDQESIKFELEDLSEQ